MARVSNENYVLDSMPAGDVLDLEIVDSRVQADPLSQIDKGVIELVEGAFKLGTLRVKVISGFADRTEALKEANKVRLQAKRYGELRPAGKITVGATVVENFTHPSLKGKTIPLVVTMTAKQYKPRPRLTADEKAAKDKK